MESTIFFFDFERKPIRRKTSHSTEKRQVIEYSKRPTIGKKIMPHDHEIFFTVEMSLEKILQSPVMTRTVQITASIQRFASASVIILRVKKLRTSDIYKKGQGDNQAYSVSFVKKAGKVYNGGQSASQAVRSALKAAKSRESANTAAIVRSLMG